VLHRVRAGPRFAPWTIAAVTALAPCPDGTVFAAGYDDGKVELFDAELFTCLAVCVAGALQRTERLPVASSAATVPTQLRTAQHATNCTRLPCPPAAQRIPGSDGCEVSSLAWGRSDSDTAWRLFAGTLEGTLLELAPRSLSVIASTDSCGGPVWCLRAVPAPSGSAAPTLAAGCSDGSVKLFAVDGGGAPGLEFLRSLPRVEGNILSLAWGPDGTSLVSGGSNGCIHVWDVSHGACCCCSCWCHCQMAQHFLRKWGEREGGEKPGRHGMIQSMRQVVLTGGSLPLTNAMHMRLCGCRE
jgi:WD40 repeat protein